MLVEAKPDELRPGSIVVVKCIDLGISFDGRVTNATERELIVDIRFAGKDLTVRVDRESLSSPSGIFHIDCREEFD